MKTYAEVIEEGVIEFSDRISETLQQALYDWFQYREVCDDEKFPVFFTRLLNRDYDQYEQILRIEPGVANYDWLVQEYRELQNYVNGQIEKNGSSEVVNSGENTHTTEYGKTVTHSGGHSITDGTTVVNGSDATTDTRQKVTSGGWTDTNTDGRTITDTQNIQTIDNDDSMTTTRGWNSTNQKQLQKQNPMSISYAGGVAEPATSGTEVNAGGALDWTTATAQGANFGRDDNGEEVVNHQGHIQTQNQRQTTGTNQDVRAYNSLTEANSGGVTHTINKTETRNYEDVDTLELTDGGSDTLTDTMGVSVNGTTSDTVSDERLQQQIYTGRHEDPAAILKRAANFILHTNAFEWLQNQLEVCFMGIYD